MAVADRKPNLRVAELSSSLVPFVYFDGVICHGAHQGVIQIELAAKTIVPDDNPKTGARNVVVVTAHVRCSREAAINLKQVLESALELEQHSHQKDQVSAVSAKPH